MLSIFNALAHVQAGMQFRMYLIMSEINCAVTLASRRHDWRVLAPAVRPLLVSSSSAATASALTGFCEKARISAALATRD